MLDPFAGSGTTVEAAITEQVRSIGVEQDGDYVALVDEQVPGRVGALW